MSIDLKSAIINYPTDLSPQEIATRVLTNIGKNKFKLKDIEIEFDKYKIHLRGKNKDNIQLFFIVHTLTESVIPDTIANSLLWKFHGFKKEGDKLITKLKVPLEFVMNDFERIKVEALIEKLLVEPNIYNIYFELFKLASQNNPNLELVEFKEENDDHLLKFSNGLRICAYPFQNDGDISNITFPTSEGIQTLCLNLYYDKDLINVLLAYLITGTIKVNDYDIIKLMKFINTHKAFEMFNFLNIKENTYITSKQLREFGQTKDNHFLFKGHIKTKKGLTFIIEMNLTKNIVFKATLNGDTFVEEFSSIDDFKAYIEEIYNL